MSRENTVRKFYAFEPEGSRFTFIGKEQRTIPGCIDHWFSEVPNIAVESVH
jgi:hypothetical protein